MGMNSINTTTSVEPGAGSKSGSNKGRGSVAITIGWGD